ncbi:hypothetical protein C493_10708 [Natronolimnohabitans innermongolicus JCM 12255]|uniref:Uncharacterized protein n=1 Tax=Natronolimnohabitans innermongolicus JCM 12255 TaxID=1227499 RepID=L9X5S7_9EURY|nr:hypothetical protein C493_10708 [Natronolimnohabitans innermongolicus JCM 12255]
MIAAFGQASPDWRVPRQGRAAVRARAHRRAFREFVRAARLAALGRHTLRTVRPDFDARSEPGVDGRRVVSAATTIR